MSYIGTKVEDCEFPKDWSIGRLDEVCHQMKQGKILPRKEIYETGTYPVFGANGCIGYSESYFLEERCVLITCRGSTCGVVNQSPAKSFVTNNAMILFEKDFLEKDFLFFALQEFSTKRLKTGSGQPQLTKGILNSHAIPLPPLPEQKKIAHILSTVQRAIEAQELIIQTTTELKKALMHKLFTEGLRNESHKQTEIGPVPESWEMVNLEATGEVVYGIQASVAKNIAPIGTRILTNKNLTLEGEFDFEKINYFELTTKRHQARILHQGDILFNWRSGSKHHVGKTAYFNLEGDWVHSSFILRIRPNSEINGRYLFYYLNFLREEEFFVKLQTYAINAKFNKSAVKALPTVVPLREEQDEIASVLDAAQKKIDFAQQQRDTLQDLIRTLLHELMTAKTRVHETSM